MDEAGVGDRRRPAGARGDGGGCGQRGAGASAVVEAGQRDVPAVDPRQREIAIIRHQTMRTPIVDFVDLETLASYFR